MSAFDDVLVLMQDLQAFDPTELPVGGTAPEIAAVAAVFDFVARAIAINPLPAFPPGQGEVEPIKFIEHNIALDMYGKPVITALDNAGQLWVTRERSVAGWERIPSPFFVVGTPNAGQPQITPW